MDKGKLKVLVMALKEIVEELESEVYSDVDAYKSPATFSSAPMSMMRCMMMVQINVSITY